MFPVHLSIPFKNPRAKRKAPSFTNLAVSGQPMKHKYKAWHPPRHVYTLQLF